MKMSASQLFSNDIFLESLNVTSPQNPFDVKTGSFQDGSEERQDIHYALEIGIMLKGRAKRFYSDYEFEVGPGQVWLCGIWEPHTRKAVQAPCERVIISVLPQTVAGMSFWPLADIDLMAPFLADPANRPQVAEQDRETMIILGRMIERIHHKEDLASKKIWYLLLLMEVLLLTIQDWKPSASDKSQRSTANFIKIGQAIHLVLNSQKRISEKLAADVCHMSLRSFRTLFQNLMGISFPQFALRYRLYNAALELLNSDEQVKKIALQWGFTDSSHFNRNFIERYGRSPSQFRRHYSQLTDSGRKAIEGKTVLW